MNTTHAALIEINGATLTVTGADASEIAHEIRKIAAPTAEGDALRAVASLVLNQWSMLRHGNVAQTHWDRERADYATVVLTA